MQGLEAHLKHRLERGFSAKLDNLLGNASGKKTPNTNEKQSAVSQFGSVHTSGDGPVNTSFLWRPSHNNKRKKAMKDIVDMSTKSTVIENASAQITGVLGRQVLTNFGSFLSNTEINTFQSPISNESNAYIKRIDWSWMVLNMANIGVYVKAYYLTCNRDTEFAPSNLWIQQVDSQATQTDMELHYGAHPYDFPNFKDYWRIDRCDNIYLAPGKHWEGLLEYKSQYYSTAEDAQVSAEYLKGISKYILLVSYGVPTGSVVTATGVATNAVFLGGTYHLNLVRCKKTEIYAFSLQGLPSYNVTGDLATTIGALNTPKILLEDVDGQATVENADE